MSIDERPPAANHPSGLLRWFPIAVLLLLCGVPPVIGPSWENFSWVGQHLFEIGLVQSAKDWRAVAALMARSLSEPPDKAQIRGRTLRYLRCRQGGTRRAREVILEYLHRSR